MQPTPLVYDSTSRKRNPFPLLITTLLLATALLTALLIHRHLPRREPAKITTGPSAIANLKTAVDAFEVDTGRYPATLNDLLTAPPNTPTWRGPYVEKIADDWGHPFHFAAPGRHNPTSYDLSSNGPDGLYNTPDGPTNFPPSR
jgi:general secretion pathway protein G